MAALKASADDYLVKRDDYLERLPRILRNALEHFRLRADSNQPSLRVLYIEHNRFDIDLLQRHVVLHAPHIHVTATTSVQEALSFFPVDAAKVAAQFDVLLIDYRLPGMDGLEFIKLLRIERKLGNREAEARYASQLRRRFVGSPEQRLLTQGQYD